MEYVNHPSKAEEKLTDILYRMEKNQAVLETRIANLEQMILELLEKSSDEENGWAE